ncbi:hypothetical protein [Antarctobacter jejuensis]|uniref:hypothetical protein n=1 Tax=Antarctobacter jejuensis TaxID=1439938 RepID=UPI003FD5BB54
MTRDDLVRFRAGFASCELVLLADISAGTVLMSDSAIRLGQEHLDALCRTAARLFDPAATLPARLAVLSGPTGCRVFLRAAGDSAEALCCLFAPGADLSAVDTAGLDLIRSEDTGT